MTENKKGTGRLSNFLITPLVFLISIPAVFYALNKGGNMTVDPITRGIVAIMVLILIIEAFAARRKMIRVTKELRNAALYNKLDDIYFSNKFLSGALSYYKREYSKFNAKQMTVPPDIAEYINEDLIANYVHREITDQIGSVMTGLGILGTFIGLTFGLERFNSETALQSTPMLLNGIKIAFYTSIFGIIASLIYNHFYYNDIEKNRDALNFFYDAFYKDISPNSEMYLANKLLDYNKQQTESLNALAGSIAGELAPKFAEAINKSVMPTMNKLNKSIDDYIMGAVKAQSKTLGDIVERFMKQLNSSLDDQFHNLSISIKQMCTYQNDSTEKLKSILGSLKTISVDLTRLNIDMANAEENRTRINEGTSLMIDRASRFVTAMYEHSETVHTWTEQLEKETELNIGYVESLQAYSEQVTKDKKEIMVRIDKFIKESKEYRSQIAESLSLSESKDTEMRTFVNATLEKLDKQTEEVSKTYSDSTKLLESSMQSISDANKSLLQNIEALSEQIVKTGNMTDDSSKQNDAYINQMKTLIFEIQKAWKEQCESLVNVQSAYNAIAEEIKNSYKGITS